MKRLKIKNKVPELIYKYRWWTLILLLGMAVVSLILIPRLKIDISFADYFSEGDSELAYYESFKEGMGTEDNYLLVAVLAEEALFEKDFLGRVNSFTKSCRKVPGVVSANSITTLRRPYAGPMGMIQTPYLNLKTPETYQEDSLTIVNDKEFTSLYLFPEAKTLTVLLEMDKSLAIREVGSLVDSVQTLITPYAFSDYHLGGLRYLELSYFRLVQREMKTSILILLGFIALVLFLLFRSVGGVLIPLGSMLLAMILLYGYLAIFERPLGVMANLFPTIVLIIGISNVIHIGVRYEQEMKRKATKREAILKSIRVIGTAIFLTSMTTAIGFFTLRISSMPALKDFGLDAAVAVMIAYVVAMLFVPGLLSIFPTERAFTNPRFQGTWDRLAQRIHRYVYQHPQRIILATLVLLGVCYWGTQKINTNNKMIMSIPESERARDDFRFFDEQLGGVRIWSMPSKPETATNSTN
jgi:predicted RND superfamily exporter protein